MDIVIHSRITRTRLCNCNSDELSSFNRNGVSWITPEYSYRRPYCTFLFHCYTDPKYLYTQSSRYDYDVKQTRLDSQLLWRNV